MHNDEAQLGTVEAVEEQRRPGGPAYRDMSQSPTETFLACFSSEQRGIFAFVRSLVFDPADADDVFQETCTALWRDFSKYEPGTNFGAWARQVARNRVLAHSKRRRNDRHQFSTDLTERLVATSEQIDDLHVARREALRKCLEGLDDQDLELIRVRYGGRVTVNDLARSQNSTVSLFYKQLARIRRRLLHCIDRALPSPHPV